MTALNYFNYGWENSPPPTVLLCCPVSDRTGAQDLSSNWTFRKAQCNRRKPGLLGRKNMHSFKSNQYWKTFTQRRQSKLCPAPGRAKFTVTSSQVFCVIQGQRSSLWRTILAKNKKTTRQHSPHPSKKKKGKKFHHAASYLYLQGYQQWVSASRAPPQSFLNCLSHIIHHLLHRLQLKEMK